ncbi:GGDEF domain-containing protein [Labrys wisconsinensis]|uniref:Diguanylate cyclase (GGDEF)-like protein n=1 Tax=Labrys wisconsinensis TaxID=425677 RepID=A0ABU0JL19_9HYPH|nr:GGDEF domain-containing protein [Labrys wisconsinensis]MDQ0474979.1 diguanylate cyclase (GGDEF)-like protein [Labrys wisconsinensis]
MASAVGGGDERSARRLKQLYDEAAQLARIGAWQCVLDGEHLTWTDGVYDLFELPRGAKLDRADIVDMYDPRSRREMESLRAEAVRSGHGFTLDAQIETAHHATRWMRLTVGVECAAGRSIRIFGTKQDVTHERALWDRLRQLAECDALTGLANRGVFEARYDELVRSDAGNPMALALVDLDRFKAINDLYGHAAGDECLRQIAERLPRAFGGASLIARIGGDEFAVLMTGSVAADLPRALATLCRPVFWHDVRIEIGVSIGLAHARRWPWAQASALFAEADAALYAAKAGGRGMACVFGEGAGLRHDLITTVRPPPAAHRAVG